MLLILLLVLILFYGTGTALHISNELLNILLVLALIGIVYQIWEGRRPL